MKIHLFTLTLVCYGLVGCSGPSESVPSVPEPSDVIVMDDLPSLTDSDGHPEHGPHGGELIELGKEAFHVEMVHDAAKVSMFVLDNTATIPVAIEVQTLTLSLKHDGKVKSFELAADRQTDDPEGRSSHFSSTNGELMRWLDAEAEGAVVLSIEGSSYTGKISHDHDHSGHDH
ncbi:hypothetical protein [Neorhodopirellula pilleata]|uniref:Uncharacterized protein n=1 Tax=Neorhodopirellula pilleata TaxID=2714738 RepID=A0A5C6A0S2_9BACT|nr:hypothetical protein [Neorhodopirellula pilleata]TWT92995.1 hypothetical protein Pla100_43110 [Neorhodopirellula pilleata]